METVFTSANFDADVLGSEIPVCCGFLCDMVRARAV